jgi:hypothetical protein
VSRGCLAFAPLLAAGFTIDYRGHAGAILEADYPEAIEDIAAVLAEMRIPIAEIIEGGGGEAPITARLRRGFNQRHWLQRRIAVERRVDGESRQSRTWTIGFLRRFAPSGTGAGAIALEVEWNNKDSFFDRDLESFRRLHADGFISLGVIVTRGPSLGQAGMRALVRRLLEERGIDTVEDMRRWGYEPTPRQREEILRRMSRARDPLGGREALAEVFAGDKFGEATTHWRKLGDRIAHGLGQPCPLLLIGVPDSVVTFAAGEVLPEPSDPPDATLTADADPRQIDLFGV